MNTNYLELPKLIWDDDGTCSNKNIQIISKHISQEHTNSKEISNIINTFIHLNPHKAIIYLKYIPSLILKYPDMIFFSRYIICEFWKELSTFTSISNEEEVIYEKDTLLYFLFNDLPDNIRKLDLDQKVRSSDIIGSYLYLPKDKDLNLLEVSALFGSLKMFNYLKEKITSNPLELIKYAIIGRNKSIIDQIMIEETSEINDLKASFFVECQGEINWNSAIKFYNYSLLQNCDLNHVDTNGENAIQSLSLIHI